MANLLWIIIAFIVLFAFLAKAPQQLVQMCLALAWAGTLLTGVAAVVWEVARRM